MTANWERATASRTWDAKVQEVLSRAVVEPVDNAPRHNLSQIGVVRQNLDWQLLVDDFADPLR